jgi:hypothetical protein
MTKKWIIIIIIGVALIAIIISSIRLFNFWNDGAITYFSVDPTEHRIKYKPYHDSAANLTYNLLFCDNINLYKANTKSTNLYPFNILFSKTSTSTGLQTIINDTTLNQKVKILAYNRQIASGHKSNKKEILAVIVEVCSHRGLNVIASFKNGTACYINEEGKILDWKITTDSKANQLTSDLFSKSQRIFNKMVSWDKPRLDYPGKFWVRITFLASDGFYWYQDKDSAIADPIEGPPLLASIELKTYLTEKFTLQNK